MDFELDGFFDVRRGSSLESRDVFTNRRTECDRFVDAVLRLRSSVAEANEEVYCRTNVLTFCGIGGIGKSALSLEFERLFLSSDLPQLGDCRYAWRANFEETELLDFETLLLSMRATLGMQRPNWPAFDIAFQVYWSLKYPGLPLQEFAASSSRARTIMGKVNLGAQVRATCETLIFGGLPVAQTAGTVAKNIIKAVRAKAKKRELFADFPAFERLMSLESASELLPFLPALLSYDLGKARSSKAEQAVFFLDNFETVQNASTELGSPEDLIARMCYIMPNVLFVVTGRNRLTWSSTQTSIHFSGLDYWPRLDDRSLEADQISIESLSDQHCVEYLSARLLKDGVPAIPADIAAAIVKQSQGLPLYLQLSAAHFHSLDGRGIAPEPTDFDRDFPQIVLRLMRDLSESERELTRAAALLGNFDGKLLQAIVPQVSDADVARFLDKHFVNYSPTAWLSYSLHAILRDSIVEHDAATSSGWSARERAHHAVIGLEALSHRVSPFLMRPDGTVGDQASAALMTVTRLLRYTDEWPSWTMELAYVLRLLWRSSALRYPAAEAPVADGAAGEFSTLCLAMALRCDGQQPKAVPLLRSLLARPHLDSTQRFFIMNRLGKTLEELGEVVEATEMLSESAGGLTGPLSAIAQKDHARFLLQQGTDQPAVDWATQWMESTNPSQRRQAIDLLGWSHFFAGRLTQAESAFRLLFDRRHDPLTCLDIHTAGRALGLMMAWAGKQEAGLVIDSARETNAGLGSIIGLAQCEMAAALHLCVHGTDVQAEQQLAVATELMLRGQYANEYWMLHFTALGMAVARGDWGGASAASDLLATELEAVSYHPHLLQLARSCKWERMSGSSTSAVGTNSGKGAEWLRDLSHLYHVRHQAGAHDEGT